MLKGDVIVIASNNLGKTKEIMEIFEDTIVTFKSLHSFNFIGEIEEDGITFAENAYKKASYTSKSLNLPALADDSGLVVESLSGRPGVHSARYLGKDMTDLERCIGLLEELKDAKNRNAYFKSVITFALPSGESISYEGVCKGIISSRIVGHNGFGYDPIFICNGFKKTFAEMTSQEKNEVSHRGIALKKIKKEINKILSWIKL